MWADDLEIVESCGFDLSLSYFDSINSISVFAATDTFAHMKGPNGYPPFRDAITHLKIAKNLPDEMLRGDKHGETVLIGYGSV